MPSSPSHSSLGDEEWKSGATTYTVRPYDALGVDFVKRSTIVVIGAVTLSIALLGALLLSLTGAADARDSFAAVVGAPAANARHHATVGVSETRLDFGRVPFGEGRGLVLVVTNTGTEELPGPTLESISTRGGSGDAFFVDTDPGAYDEQGCPNVASLAPGAFCLFNFTFAPVNDTRGKYRGDACFVAGTESFCVDLLGRLDQTV